MTAKKPLMTSTSPFGKLLGRLAKVPYAEVMEEERKYEEAKRRRQKANPRRKKR